MTQTARAEDPKIAGPNSFLRVLHAVPGGPKVDVFIDGQKKLNDVTFGSMSKYLRLSSGYHVFSVKSNNPSRTLVQGARNLRADDFYTLGAYASHSRTRLFALDDSLGSVPSSQARITFAHLSPGAPPVDVVATTKTGRSYLLLRKLGYGHMRAANVPAVPMTITLRYRGGILKTVPNVEPRAGRKYSAYAIGRIGQNFQVLLEPSASQ